jgi:hypothetical protein
MRWTVRGCACFAGLAMFVVVSGCANKEPDEMTFISHRDGLQLEPEIHSHPVTGPHGGELIELGNGDYHAELIHNESTHTVAIYLLDEHATSSVASLDHELVLNLLVNRKPIQFVLPVVSGTGNSVHQSHYELSDDKLCHSLDVPKTTGRFSVNIDGKHFTGKIAGHSHHHDGHSHDGHNHDGHGHDGHNHDGHSHDGPIR